MIVFVIISKLYAKVSSSRFRFVLDHNHPFLSGSSVLVHPGRRSPDGPDTPTVQQHPNPAVEEERLTLSCASDSLPPAAFTWEFQRRPLVPGPQHVIAELDEDHLGNYTCTARNDLTGLVVSTVYTLNGLLPKEKITKNCKRVKSELWILLKT